MPKAVELSHIFITSHITFSPNYYKFNYYAHFLCLIPSKNLLFTSSIQYCQNLGPHTFYYTLYYPINLSNSLLILALIAILHLILFLTNSTSYPHDDAILITSQLKPPFSAATFFYHMIL